MDLDETIGRVSVTIEELLVKDQRRSSGSFEHRHVPWLPVARLQSFGVVVVSPGAERRPVRVVLDFEKDAGPARSTALLDVLATVFPGTPGCIVTIDEQCEHLLAAGRDVDAGLLAAAVGGVGAHMHRSLSRPMPPPLAGWLPDLAPLVPSERPDTKVMVEGTLFVLRVRADDEAWLVTHAPA